MTKLDSEMKLLMMKCVDYAKSGSGTELPVAAILVAKDGQILRMARNEILSGGLEHHAEISLIQKSTKLELEGSTVVCTLEPCPMCAWGLRLSRIAKLVFAVRNDIYGAAGSRFDLLRLGNVPFPRVEVHGGVLESEAGKLLPQFFRQLR